jgi:alanine dehydrogenase
VRIGVPAEVKVDEYRVALTPAGVRELVRAGHEVLVQAGAGAGSSIPDEEFAAEGAKILATADEVWADADLLLKVKEPVPSEYPFLHAGQILFTYLHLAASLECTQALLASGTAAVAYETVALADGTLPLLYPMSEVAGRMAPQVGAHWLEREAGGRGVLLGGVPGVPAAEVVILGAGVAGTNAAAVSAGMGARTTVIDRDVRKLRRLDATYRGGLRTLAASRYEIERAVGEADLVIGAVLIPGNKAPKLVDNDLVRRMRRGAVLVDISIDQGGCFADSRPTTHSDPVFAVHDTLFYCVANMPGAVPNTSTFALTNATLPYVLEIANNGLEQAVLADPALRGGVNVISGRVVHPGVAEAHGLPCADLEEAMAA